MGTSYMSLFILANAVYHELGIGILPLPLPLCMSSSFLIRAEAASWLPRALPCISVTVMSNLLYLLYKVLNAKHGTAVYSLARDDG